MVDELKNRLRNKAENIKLANESASDFDMESDEAKEVTERKTYGVKITENQMFDALEMCSYGILQNLRRSQCMDIMAEYFQEQGIKEGPNADQISRHRLTQIYKNARQNLFTRKISDLNKERNKYVRDMNRLALKAEHSMDFANAIKALKEIAEVTGVFNKQDDSKITLNFLPALKKDLD